MKQLELRSYPRAEIADVLSVNLKDSKHFKRNVENKLSKWGYGYNYTTRAIQITSKPTTPAERLSELLYRGYDIDIQINPMQFACFIAAFTEIDGFDSMPWAEREKTYYKRFGYSVDERTLRNWCSQLITKNIVSKYGDATAWKTEIINGRKYRFPIDEEDEDERQTYFTRRKELYSESYSELLKEGKSPQEARAQAWSDTYKQLWAEYKCCYYYCKNFTLNAFDNNMLVEIYELVDELAGVASTNADIRNNEFHNVWFT